MEPKYFNKLFTFAFICRCAESLCLMNQASCGCCLMQQQIHRMRMFFNASLSELEKELMKTQNTLNSVRGEAQTQTTRYQ